MGSEGIGGFGLWPEACVGLALPLGTGLGLQSWDSLLCCESSMVCTWLVNTCMLYFWKFFSLFLPGDYLACAYHPSFFPLWVMSINSGRHNSSPKFLNTGCEKKKTKKNHKKGEGERRCK